ncbi:MAG: carbonic anhydrase [Actinomycetaceae bacterium]|nr:carbonic anhydrase [Actinomycetaceae bacterium]
MIILKQGYKIAFGNRLATYVAAEIQGKIMDVIDQLLSQNREFAGSFPGEAAGAPTLHVAIVTCMDSRLHPYDMFGLSAGEAHFLRNAGGIVTEDTLRTLSISQHELGTTHIMLVQHSDCGMSKTKDDDFLAELREETGQTPGWVPGGFDDVEESVRAGMAKIQASPFIDSTNLRGFVYDVKTGLVHEVFQAE